MLNCINLRNGSNIPDSGIQSYELISQYLSGKTVISVNVRILESEGPPTITLCLPGLISIDRVLTYLKDSSNYEMLSQYTLLKKDVMTDYTNQTNLDKLKETYKLTGDKLNEQGISAHEMLANLSIPTSFTFEFLQSSDRNIELYQDKTPGESSTTVTKVVESFKHSWDQEPIYLIKCFTFFSHLMKEWRDNWVDFKYIKIVMGFSLDEFPAHNFSYKLSLHSPNTLPEMNKENALLLESKYNTHFISYSQINKELLDSRYDTNLSLKIPTGEHYLDYSLKGKCVKECRPDCKFKYFLWDNLGDEPPEKEFNQDNIIYIRHNRMPDIIIKYLPQTSLISLVCNFGGLLGMWLGLSILVIIEEGKLVFSRLFKLRFEYNRYWRKVLNLVKTNIVLRNPKINQVKILVQIQNAIK